jgi:hypothetical protein
MKRCIVLALLFLCLPVFGQGSGIAPKTSGLVQNADLQNLVPPAVYFSGQTATVELRNSAGVRWAPSKQTLFAMVDASGYSSAVREKYQFYILTDEPVEIAGHMLQPGAYGAGFLESTGLLVMDLGGNELFHSAYSNDPEMKRPRPLQVLAGSGPGEYRLYLGRNYVVFRQK